MRGYVLVYRPQTCEGTIVSDDGESLGFRADDPGVDYCGGDVVSFRRRSPGSPGMRADAIDVQLASRWAQAPAPGQKPMIAGLFASLLESSPSPNPHSAFRSRKALETPEKRPLIGIP